MTIIIIYVFEITFFYKITKTDAVIIRQLDIGLLTDGFIYLVYWVVVCIDSLLMTCDNSFKKILQEFR